MDQNVISYVAVITSIASIVLGIINHKRIRSSCCGRDVTTSIDIESTTPPGAKAGDKLIG